VANTRDIELASFVAVFDVGQAPKLQVNAQTVRSLENKLKQTVQGGEGATERGLAQLIIVPRDRVEVILENERVEVRRRYLTDLAQDGPMMAEIWWSVFDSLNVDPNSFPWVRFGYNLNLSVLAKPTAIEKIADGLFSDNFQKNLGYQLSGAAAWTWLKVASDVTLWLRLEPSRNDPTADQLAVTANFLVENGNLPTQNEVATYLDEYSAKMNDLLDRIGL